MLEVIGAGLGRTGTHSLAQALEILGFGPCYTILDVNRNPGHFDLWTAAVAGEAVDWQKLYHNYRSAVEWPTVAFLPSILAQYPSAKVVLTLRDADSWYESASVTIFPALESTAKHPDPQQRARSTLKRRLILQDVFGGKYWDKEHALSVYKNHNRSVIDLVPGERLLQYSITEGWEPLCRFLAVDIPGQVFPHRNERAEFIRSAPDWAKDDMRQG
ncbi:MAG: sulfotransferase family protein [Anaerolineae bacterium]|nr:sulfotransferase family protein [Anaerolineae bacterium]